jgi:myo-inositol-1(or 4)-monophosphatase
MVVAADAARSAGAILMSHYGRLAGFDRKGAVDLVSVADRESEAFLRETLLGAFPDDGLLGEEGSRHEGTSGYRWIADPLDGTTNFVHTHPMFCVSIGLERSAERRAEAPDAPGSDRGGRVVGGCVYLPYYDELFRAAEGEGAFLNDRPIRVSRTATVNDAVLASGFPYNRRQTVDDLLAIVRRAVVHALGFRRSGSAAIDLCYVASGRCDGFWEQDLHPWDLAGGEIIVREAGGRVTDWAGGPHSITAGRTLASNGIIHDELRRALFEGL